MMASLLGTMKHCLLSVKIWMVFPSQKFMTKVMIVTIMVGLISDDKYRLFCVASCYHLVARDDDDDSHGDDHDDDDASDDDDDINDDGQPAGCKEELSLKCISSHSFVAQDEDDDDDDDDEPAGCKEYMGIVMDELKVGVDNFVCACTWFQEGGEQDGRQDRERDR